ncbi:MalY/PatB family protein [Guggenheimella bovis]
MEKREDTFAVKYTYRKALFGREDVIPLWVADMDLPTAEPIVEGIIERAKHPIYGYTDTPKEAFEAFKGYYKRHHKVDLGENISYASNLLQGLLLSFRAELKEHDKVLVFPPVYFPFYTIVKEAGMELVHCPLKHGNERYEIDWELFHEKVKEVQAVLLCSPHNPVGRVWDKEELERIVKATKEQGVKLYVDEIHADIVYEKDFTSIRAITEDCVLVTGPGKTFNIAGLQGAFIVHSSKDEKKRFQREAEHIMALGMNAFNAIAFMKAYGESDEWHKENLDLLRKNRDLLIEGLKEMGGYEVHLPEATYLAWISFKNLELTPEDFFKRMADKGVGVQDGRTFSPGGEYYTRVNFAHPTEHIEKALKAFKEVLLGV